MRVQAPDLLDTSGAGPAALRGSVLRAGAYVAGILLALVSAPLLIRHLGQADFGRYFTVVSLIAIVTGLTEGGLNSIAIREYTTLTGAERSRLMANLLGMRVALSSAGGALAVVVAMVLGYGSELVLGTLVAAIGMVFQVSQSMLIVPLQSTLRFGQAAALELLRQVVNVALIVVLVVLGASILPLLAVPIPACLIALVATAVVVRSLMGLRPRFELGVWRPLLRDTLTYATAIALNALYLRITVVLMSLISTDVQTGYFSTSFRVVEVLIGVPILVVGAAFPILTRAARDDAERFRYAVARVFELSVIVGAWVVLCIGITAGFAVDILGGAEAAPAAGVLRIQAGVLLATFVAVACSFPLLSLRRHRELLVANVLALGVSVVLTLVLVPVWDARGAAVAAVSAELALAVATALLLVRARPGLSLPGSAPAVALVAAGVGVLPAVVLDVHPLIAALAATVLFAAVLRLLGRFPPEVRELLRRRRGAADS